MVVEWLIGRDTRESGPALEQALIDGLRCGGASADLGRRAADTGAGVSLGAAHRVAGGDDHRVAQPVRRQRRQDLRRRRAEARPTRSSGRSKRRIGPPVPTLGATSTPVQLGRRCADYCDHLVDTDRRRLAATVCASCSTAPTGRCIEVAPDVTRAARRRRDRDQRRAERAQHQRPLRRHVTRHRCRPRSSSTAPTSGWPSTATATG